MIATLQAAIVGILRTSGLTGIAWGTATTPGSPYYKELPEPAIPFPFVAFDIPPSDLEYTFNGSSSPGAYIEEYHPEFFVIGLETHIDALLSPYTTNSVIQFLDTLRATPALLNGDNFTCHLWYRENFELSLTGERGPTGERVWAAAAQYRAAIVYQ